MAQSFDLIPPNIPIFDPRTGLVTREWYKYFNNIQQVVGGSGASTGSLEAANFITTAPPVPREPDDALVPPAIPREDDGDLLVPPPRDILLGTMAFETAADYALLSGATFTGAVFAPTAAPGTNTTQVATTAFVTAAVAGSVTTVTGSAPIVSSGGTTPDISITAATTSAAGSMSGADKTKLDGIATGATANQSDAYLLSRANHTGTQTAATISDFSEATDDRVSSLLVAGANITLTYDDGANTLTVDASGPDITPPVVADFSWVNQGTATATDNDEGIFFTNDVDSEQHILEMATPSVPFDVYACFDPLMLDAAPSGTPIFACCLAVRDSSGGDLVVFETAQQHATNTAVLYRLRIQRWTNPTTASTAPVTYYTTKHSPWIRLNVTSTTITFYTRISGQWVEVGTETIATFIGTVDRVGVSFLTTTGMDFAFCTVRNFSFTDPFA